MEQEQRDGRHHQQHSDPRADFERDHRHWPKRGPVGDPTVLSGAEGEYARNGVEGGGQGSSGENQQRDQGERRP